MTIASQIEQLENLAAVDADLALLEEEQAKEETGVREKRERHTEVTARVAVSRESLADMERTRSDVFTEIRQMSAQIEKSREKMSRCRNEKETIAVQRELEELRRLIRDRELDAEKLAQLIEHAKSDIATSQAEIDRLDIELGLVEGPSREKSAELDVRVAEKRAERKAIVVGLKPQMLSRYEMIRKRRGTAVASTTDGTCSACHISVPPMMMQELMRQEQLGQCPQCNRILYFRSSASHPPPEPPQEGT